MMRPTRKAPIWAIAMFIVMGTVAVSWGVVQLCISTPAELQTWSYGRGLPLPLWGWITLSIVIGVWMLAMAGWSAYWRRRW
ncbi:hypothetical protein [Planctomonas psychrotolerans]|uniref:hypothetical protein n=1 Tax=Planctomonas psychrotolerans TaxID=2528712 RepID=UPI00123A9A15|nr:hypothetical protein [Planctomonas psychrotolerans]